MAQIDVASWEAFRDALTSSANGDIINVTSDLDANNSPLTEGVDINASLIVHGNGHTLFNLSASTVLKEAFMNVAGNISIHVDNMNFYNIHSIENYGIFSSYSLSNDSGWYFDTCNFQGRSSYLFNGVRLTKCAVNYDLGINGSINLDDASQANRIEATNCYFNISVIYNSTGRMLYGPICNCYFMSTCYVGGEITINTDSTTAACVILGTNPQPGCTNNCLNFKCNRPEQLTASNARTANFVNPITIYNLDYAKMSTALPQYIVGCTDAEMHDAKALQAKGFDIVVTS